MEGKTGYPVSWYTNDKEEGDRMEIEATSADRNLLLEVKGELDHHGARDALRELEQRALQMGADAVVGVKMDYEVLGADNGMLMVTVSGTAVTLK